MTICWLITELSEHAESLPCRELNNSECDRISSVIDVNCQTPKEAKRVDRKCDHLPYNKTLKCIKQWCGKWEPFRYNKKISANQQSRSQQSDTNSMLDVYRKACAGFQSCEDCKAYERKTGWGPGCDECCAKSKSKFQSSPDHFLADLQPSRFSANRPDTNRLDCQFSGSGNPCDACKTAEGRGVDLGNQGGGCGPCCPSGNGGKGNGSEQPNHYLYIMVIIKWMWDLLNN